VRAASWLERELDEQPDALARLLDAEAERAVELAAVIDAARPDYLLIASRGSSSNAARYAQYVLGSANRIPIAFATPSLYTLYGTPPRLDGSVVIGISQSGASPDVAAVVAEGGRQGRPTIAITNDETSPLAAAADHTLPLHAGPERAVAATKTYLNSLGAVALLSAALARDERRLAELREMPQRVAAQLERSREECARLDAYADAEAATVVARGVNYGTAFEVALKIRELSGVLVEAYSVADLLHGPIAALGHGRLAILVAPSGSASASMAECAAALRERGAALVGISDDATVLARVDTRLELVPGTPEWLSPLVAVLPGQVAARRLARLRGIDVDRPLGLRKVTLTR
jgi:glucosamine--fructose-6-phosphate aminotransferase (isomerizing)